MRQAFSTAENMEYAMNVEKKTAAQLETLLDYSYSGVIRLDGNGVITAVNPLMEDMIGKTEEELKGENIRKAAPMIGEEAWKRVFEKGEDYSLFFEWNGTPIFAVLAPVLYEDWVDGAIITCHKMKKKTGKKKNLFSVVNYTVLVLTVIAAVYIMANGLGLIDSLDFGAGAYYYADIPQFAKYVDGSGYTSPVSMWVLIALFLIWGFFMYKLWGWIEKKDK